MDENWAWKIVYIAAIFSLIIMALTYYFISPRESPYFTEEKTQKIAEFKNTHIEGRKEGKKVWEFFAREGWTEPAQEVTFLYQVSKGFIYKDGKPAVSELSAPRAKAYRHSEIVEAFGVVKAYLDLGKFSSRPKDKSQWTKMVGDYIKYIPADKRSEIAGNITLTKRDSVINADKIDIDHERKIARVSGKIRIDRKDGLVNAGEVEYIGEEEQINAAGGVNLKLKESKVSTFIKCSRGILFMDMDKDMALSGSLEVLQGKKISIADEGTYSRKQKGLFLRGRTRTVVEKAQAILQEDTVKKLGSPEQKDLLRGKTVVSANEIFFSTRTGDARATGSVEVTQKGREARSETAVYDDKNETLTLTGNVQMKKAKEWISAGKVIVSVRDETFEALGSAEAQFKL